MPKLTYEELEAREQEACEALRHIAFYLGVGGYNAPDPIDIEQYHKKILEGIADTVEAVAIITAAQCKKEDSNV